MDPASRHLLDTRGLLAAVELREHRPSVEGTFVWLTRPDDGIINADCTVYTDGSMIDGPYKATGRVGFGIVAYDADGVLVAKGHGTPPCWIDTVPGAEA